MNAGGLAFGVRGKAGEKVEVAVIVPAHDGGLSDVAAAASGVVAVVAVTVGPSGVGQVECSAAGCRAAPLTTPMDGSVLALVGPHTLL